MIEVGRGEPLYVPEEDPDEPDSDRVTEVGGPFGGLGDVAAAFPQPGVVEPAPVHGVRREQVEHRERQVDQAEPEQGRADQAGEERADEQTAHADRSAHQRSGGGDPHRCLRRLGR